MRVTSNAKFRRLSTRVVCLVTLLFLFASVSGCTTLIGALRLNAADKRFSYGAPSGPKNSQGVTQTLKAYDVPTRSSIEQLDALLAKVEQTPTPELVYAYVETSYLTARSLEKKRPTLASQIYASSALYAYHYLFNPALNAQRDSSVFNAQLLDVCMLYNGACERLLHLTLQSVDATRPFPFRHGEASSFAYDSLECSIYTSVVSCSWRPEELESFQLAADCPVDALDFDCRRAGLGVPLVAKRRANAFLERVEEEYYPAELRFPASAILRPNPTRPLGSLPAIEPNARVNSQEERDADMILELYDPLVQAAVQFSGRTVTIESDLTTPLAYFLNEKSHLNSASGARGLFKPEELLELVPTDSPTRERTLKGLYMLEPYDPKKIPVVMTHGLGSSPSTWLEMYNALRNASEIRESYQFWFYFYPTGQPFWASAAMLRSDLRRLRETVDPYGQAPALDQTILVGHSMGGLISRMQVQSSGDRIWSKISARPFEEVEFDEETRDDLRSWFFFDADPSVRRVITIATPFEGSEFANGFTQWVAEKTIAIPQTVARVLTTTNSNEWNKISDLTLLQTTTSVDSLSPKSPIFAALDECPIPEDVALNNIVGVLPALENRKLSPKKSDGVVEFWSSHRDDVESEREVSASHSYVHTHPAAILEVKDVLSRHLTKARQEMRQAVSPRRATSSRANKPTTTGLNVNLDLVPSLTTPQFGPKPQEFNAPTFQPDSLDDAPYPGGALPIALPHAFGDEL